MRHDLLKYLSFQAKHEKPGYTYELSTERIENIEGRLHQFMREQMPFLQFGYSIRDLADDLDIPSYQLSAYLNREIGLNFNDYLNQFRVRYCEELMQKGLIGQLNLKGLALKCGFSNRNTLTTAFKKFTGFTPSVYTRHILSFRRSTSLTGGLRPASE
jgi:AraC-like DNA-binding protein